MSLLNHALIFQSTNYLHERADLLKLSLHKQVVIPCTPLLKDHHVGMCLLYPIEITTTLTIATHERVLMVRK